MKDSILIIKDTFELAKHPVQTITKNLESGPIRDWLDYVDVFGGIASSIIIFVLGIVFSNIISRRKTKRKNKEYYDFFIEYLKQQKQSIDGQIDELIKTKTRMAEMNYHRAPELRIRLQQFYMLDSFNKEQLMSAYKVKKKEPSKLMDVLHELEYARLLIKDIESSLQSYSTRQNELTNLLNEDLKQWDALTRKDNKFLVEVVKQTDQNKLKQLAEIEQSLKQNKETSTEMILQYHIPTVNLLIEIDNNTPDARLQEFITIGRNMEHILRNKELIASHFKNRIDNAIEGLQNVSLNIEQ